MIRKVALFLMSIHILGLYSPGQTMSHEEIVVRTAYARLAYASQLDAIYHLSTQAWRLQNPTLDQADMDKDLDDARVTVHLGNFVVGKTAEIAQTPIAEIVSPEPASILKAIFSGHSVQDEHMKTPSQFSSAELHWIPGPNSGLSPEAKATIEKMSLAAVFTANEPSSPPVYEKYPRYVAFLSTVTYMGVTAGPYRALFLFGTDATGKEIISPYDTTTQDGLALALGTPLYPTALLETNRRRLAVVSRWLDSSQVEDSCSLWQHDVCCNLTTLRCGMTATMLQTARSKPLPATSWKLREEVNHASDH